MKRSAFLFLLAASAVAEDAALTAARTALAENLPLIALQKLANTPASTEASLLRAEAQLAANQPDAALSTLDSLVKAGAPAAELLRAHAFAKKGRWSEARAAYMRALALVQQGPERRYLERRLRELAA